jgi:hypothetical protein
MTCPFLHEVYRTNRVTMRQQLVELTVPGMKKHVRRVHGESAYRQVKWPDPHEHPEVRRRATPGTLAAMTLNELRSEAKRLRFDPRGLSRKELARALLRLQ